MIPLSSSTSQRKSSVVAKMTSGSSTGMPSPTSLLTKLKGAIRSVVSDSNARNLMGFLALNFVFAFVELAYGMWTNSLGLISDSFHMFFDCTGLVAGLAAQVVSRWPADDSFAYGYKRAEVLAGFVNALFLLFIAFFILTEAVERAIEPPEVHHDRLFVVSVLGLLVNLVGIYVFQHGGSHGHSHGGGHGHSHGGGHGHSHGGGGGGGHGHSHDAPGDDPYNQHHQVSISMGGGGGHQQNNASAPTSGTGQSGHSHQNHLMKGVLLHILADTLGSVGVVISALLMRAFGWMRADPVCSIFIAVLVAASVWGLLRDSARVLMMRTPVELDDERRVLDACYSRLHRYHPAVMGIQEPRFWTLCADTYAGSIKIEVRSGFIGSVGPGGNSDYAASLSPSPLQFAGQTSLQSADAARLLHDRDQFANGLVRYAQQVFGAVGVRNLYVQIDYAGEDMLNHNHSHHHVNDVQRQNSYATTGSLLDQPQQQFQAYNQTHHHQQQQQQQQQQHQQHQQQQQQQQQYTNPLLMM
ncbi:zinc transporter 7 [Rhopalosiphum maidis]|uniref:zinc transporter 7 n=1 Tax=Rhopalosiphum maidis TaxID=43146 RepID=UPI000F00313B|nr:zinc transporter 7 [Rhopalosiphum maidis]